MLKFFAKGSRKKAAGDNDKVYPRNLEGRILRKSRIMQRAVPVQAKAVNL